MKRKIAVITLVTACALLFTLFAYASYEKLKIYPTFVQQLSLSPVKDYKNFLAWFVPSVEILLALSLLFKRTRLTGLWGSFFLMMAFTVYVFAVPHFFHSLHTCSCGGIISQLSWRGHFYMNLCFTLLAGAAVSLFPFTRKQLA